MPFCKLTSATTGGAIWVNTDLVVCVWPAGNQGTSLITIAPKHPDYLTIGVAEKAETVIAAIEAATTRKPATADA